MSIYIKNAETPKRCAECTFETLASDDMHYCTVEDILTEDYRDYCRLPLCPLNEVPEPHGRLIDADKLKKEVLMWMPSDPCGIAEKEHPIDTDIVVSLMIEIEEAPTVIEGSEPLER